MTPEVELQTLQLTAAPARSSSLASLDGRLEFARAERGRPRSERGSESFHHRAGELAGTAFVTELVGAARASAQPWVRTTLQLDAEYRRLLAGGSASPLSGHDATVGIRPTYEGQRHGGGARLAAAAHFAGEQELGADAGRFPAARARAPAYWIAIRRALARPSATRKPP